MANPEVFVVAMCVLGLVVGSFVNVVVFRLPRMMEATWRAECLELLEGAPARETERFDLVRPPSACPACGHGLTALEMIPVVSYAMLRGRCSACRTRIPLRYPIVELCGALVAGSAAIHFGPGVEALAASALGVGTACGELHRYRGPVAARFHYPAAALAGPCGQPDRHVRTVARLRHRSDRRISPAVDRLSWIQAGDWSGGDGTRRFQAARRTRRMAGMACASGTGWFSPRWRVQSAAWRLVASGRASRGTALPFGPYLAVAGLAVLYGAGTVAETWTGWMTGAT